MHRTYTFQEDAIDQVEVFPVRFGDENAAHGLPIVCRRRMAIHHFPDGAPKDISGNALLDVLWENAIVAFLDAGRSIAVPVGDEGCGRLQRIVNRWNGTRLTMAVLDYQFLNNNH